MAKRTRVLRDPCGVREQFFVVVNFGLKWWIFRGCWTFLGLFFPVFYLQLDAVLHGVDKNVAFYSVGDFCSICSNIP
jgi:hypothetical protein